MKPLSEPRLRGAPFSRKEYCADPEEYPELRSAMTVSANWRADLPWIDCLFCRDLVGKYVVTAREVGDKRYHLNISINSPDSNEKTLKCPILQH
jgi:hypothetical protein